MLHTARGAVAERRDAGIGTAGPRRPVAKQARTVERAAVVLALALYVICFAAFPPRVLIVSDEASYVRQSQALAAGRLTVETRNPQTGERLRVLPSSYPIGTSALQVPFVWVGGWRAASVASVLSLITTVLVLMRWLEREGRSPLFALLVLGFPPALFMGRIAMSDVPSMALTTVGLFLFFRADGGSFRDWLIAGLFAGVSLALRESNPLVFVVLFAGAVIRRDRNWPALLLGGLLGGSVRPLTAFLITGDPFFVRHQAASILALHTAAHNVVLYLFALLVMVPGGLIAAVAYRGRRRPEVIATILGFTAFYATYGYGAVESGWQRQLILGPRFFLPLLPLLVVAIADVVPRLIARARSAPLRRLVTLTTTLWVLAVLIAIVATHVVVDRWGRTYETIVRALYDSTRPGIALVVDPKALYKYANELYGDRIILSWEEVPADMIPRALGVYGSLQVALLYRSDSDYWVKRGREADNYIQRVAAQCQVEMVHDAPLTQSDRLRVWDVVGCAPSNPSR